MCAQLSYSQTLPWTSVQETNGIHPHPFGETENESVQDSIIRIYLQFLWLPQGIVPLEALVPSILRVNVASGSDTTKPHSLHHILEPLLRTARAVFDKYHTELPEILSQEGGVGDIEENVMWHALLNEKGPDDDRSRTSSAGSSSSSNNYKEELWRDETWKKSWLDRLERREVQIQVLLLLLKLSLPGPPPPEETELPTKHKKRRRKNESETNVKPSTQARLESFMDKLSTWQLMVKLESENTNFKAVDSKEKQARDWMQIFCEDIVEPRFKSTLPEQISLLREKLFPSSPFSESDNDEASSEGNSSSAANPARKRRRTTDVVTSTKYTAASRYPSPALSIASDANREQSIARSRSRSLSVSLAQEKERERAPTRKRMLVREVSMSRGFKAKVPPTKPPEKHEEQILPKTGSGLFPEIDKSTAVTLVAATPVKSKRAPLLRTESLPVAAFDKPKFGEGIGLGLSFTQTAGIKRELSLNDEWNPNFFGSSPLSSEDGSPSDRPETTPTKSKRTRPSIGGIS